jgi:hypothetical protein
VKQLIDTTCLRLKIPLRYGDQHLTAKPWLCWVLSQEMRWRHPVQQPSEFSGRQTGQSLRLRSPSMKLPKPLPGGRSECRCPVRLDERGRPIFRTFPIATVHLAPRWDPDDGILESTQSNPATGFAMSGSTRLAYFDLGRNCVKVDEPKRVDESHALSVDSG